MDILIALTIFFITSIVVIVSAKFLVASGEVISSRTGWGQVWVGTLLLAGATSLPELVATSTASFLGTPDLAGGAIFGSNMLNMTILAVTLAIFGGNQVLQKIMPQQTAVAIFALSLTIVAVFLSALQVDIKWIIISPASLIIIACYALGSRILFRHSSSADRRDNESTGHTLKWGWTVFALSSATICLATFLLTSSAANISDITGISASFIGVIALAFVTSLPEISTSVAALRMGTPDLAVSNLYGSNAFNIIILALADCFFRNGSIFGNLDVGAIVAGLLAILLMSLGVLQLLLRKSASPFSLYQHSALVMTTIYIGGVFLVFYIG